MKTSKSWYEDGELYSYCPYCSKKQRDYRDPGGQTVCSGSDNCNERYIIGNPEPKQIDLSVSQIVDPPAMVEVSNDGVNWSEADLITINHQSLSPFYDKYRNYDKARHIKKKKRVVLSLAGMGKWLDDHGYRLIDGVFESETESLIISVNTLKYCDEEVDEHFRITNKNDGYYYIDERWTKEVDV